MRRHGVVTPARQRAQADRVFLHARLQELIGDLMPREPRPEDGVVTELSHVRPSRMACVCSSERLVSVFDAQQELATLMAREKPVEEGRPGASNVQVTRGGWSEADANSHRSQ
jgi:hypothetical protein